MEDCGGKEFLVSEGWLAEEFPPAQLRSLYCSVPVWFCGPGTFSEWLLGMEKSRIRLPRPAGWVGIQFMNPLQRHPFAVRAFFERVAAISFAFPVETLRPLVSEGLEIDDYEGLGFVTVAMVWTKRLRPAVFPEILGQDFFLSGYRIFTRLRDESGRRLRGLQILRSETDKQRMVTSGNLLTRYRYRRVIVDISRSGTETRVRTRLPSGNETLDLAFDDVENASLPEGSPFPDWRTARRFAGPMPFTFSREGDGSFVVIEGSRGDWRPRPIDVKHWRVAFFEESPLAGITPVLANAFMVENVEYRWERGRIVKPGGVD
jgi:hypothetical protein